MHSIFEVKAKDEILQRIEKLEQSSIALWGKMNVSQMLAHCANAMGLATGKINPPRQWSGRLFGWMFKSSYSSEKNFPKNIPTIKGGSVLEEKDFAAEKERLILAIEEMHAGGEKICTSHPHPIMGKMRPVEWGKGMYKHLDHHLRQFGI
jgi:hypothetical protein